MQNSTTGQEYAQENSHGAELVVFEDLGLLLTAVQTGQVDAAINDNGALLDFVKKNPDLAVTKEFDTGEQYGIGVQEGQHRAARGDQRDAHRGEVQRQVRQDLREVVREGPGPELTP